MLKIFYLVVFKSTINNQQSSIHWGRLNMRLKDRTAIVTGGARGLGRAFALRLAQEGAQVMVMNIVLGDKDLKDMKETVRLINETGARPGFLRGM